MLTILAVRPLMQTPPKRMFLLVGQATFNYLLRELRSVPAPYLPSFKILKYIVDSKAINSTHRFVSQFTYPATTFPWTLYYEGKNLPFGSFVTKKILQAKQCRLRGPCGF